MPDLGLQQASRHLEFLVSEKGYTPTESTPHRVRFESPVVFVEMLFDGERFYELGLVIGRIDLDDPPFTIAEILRLRNAPEAKSFALVQVMTDETMATWGEMMAEALRNYGEDFIDGRERSFTELAAQRHEEGQAYARERELRSARAKAEMAWREKDYASVVRLLEPMQDDLTPSEIGRLDFSRKYSGR